MKEKTLHLLLVKKNHNFDLLGCQKQYTQCKKTYKFRLKMKKIMNTSSFLLKKRREQFIFIFIFNMIWFISEHEHTFQMTILAINTIF